MKVQETYKHSISIEGEGGKDWGIFSKIYKPIGFKMYSDCILSRVEYIWFKTASDYRPMLKNLPLDFTIMCLWSL